jgi:hypothetical protein
MLLHHLWRLNLARELRIVIALTDRRIAAERVPATRKGERLPI